jgi:micrococcal nuclease
MAVYLWLRTSQASQLRLKAWRSLRIEFLSLGAAAAFFAITDFAGLLSAADAPAFIPESSVAAHVVRVIDGDTIVVRLDGVEQRVRYIGMDAPETVHPTRGVEPFGIEASNLNKRLVEDDQVWLEKDVSETDQYGRLLRYVWLADGHMANVLLVEEGYAQVDTWPPDVRYQAELLRAQQDAQQNDRGLWSR